MLCLFPVDEFVELGSMRVHREVVTFPKLRRGSWGWGWEESCWGWGWEESCVGWVGLGWLVAPSAAYTEVSRGNGAAAARPYLRCCRSAPVQAGGWKEAQVRVMGAAGWKTGGGGVVFGGHQVNSPRL